MRKIYLAGPSVFSDNAKDIGKSLKSTCKKYGFEGLYPLDNEIKETEGKRLSKLICDGNISCIKEADFVIADLNPFRGQCMDDGTAFEIGYATSLGKTIYGFMDDTKSLREKIGDRDNNGYNVENFNLPINLMIAESCNKIVRGNFEDCIATMKKDLEKNRPLPTIEKSDAKEDYELYGSK
jgi:nucleoside 2-deoxyribosyltransferase